MTIGMKKHILRAIESFSDEITRSAVTPARGYLFEVREGATKLDEARADNFHSVVAAILFISRRCRLVIQVGVAFLTTRVSTIVRVMITVILIAIVVAKRHSCFLADFVHTSRGQLRLLL